MYEPVSFACLENFEKCNRLPGETHLASHLRSCWMNYCRDDKDFDSLADLIISENIFDILGNILSTPIAVRRVEDCRFPVQLSKDCDIYFSAKDRSFEEKKIEKQPACLGRSHELPR
ncbi:uncharacterized protein NPIL_28591 [Nephila pilipes]|uniref:Uncharacterized protein n=1 Tax=Nephila pilipes TaxID=299642 RepID=A0A8X6R2F5_NEPPI|nr:uncharacterized protein NPIL_28591 [Nephila pilipes]